MAFFLQVDLQITAIGKRTKVIVLAKLFRFSYFFLNLCSQNDILMLTLFFFSQSRRFAGRYEEKEP
jgi:hypothetical protein